MLENPRFRYQAKGATTHQEGIKAEQTAQWGGATLKLSAKSNLNTPLNVGKGRGGEQTYHQSVYFHSLRGALIWNRSKTGSVLVNEGDRWVIFPLGFGFGDEIITRWRGEGWKQTVGAARPKEQKGSRDSPRRAPLSKCGSLRPAAVFVGRHWEAAFWRDLAWAELLSVRKKKSLFPQRQQIFICEFAQAASWPKVCDTNLNCTLNNR